RSLRDWSSDVCSSDLHFNVDHEMFVSMDTFAFNNASTASPNFSYGRKDPTATGGTQEQMECFEQAAGGVEIFHCPNLTDGSGLRSEERRVGKECRSRW